MTATEIAARNPLFGGFVIIGIGVLVSRLLLKQHPIWRAIAQVLIFILLTTLLMHGGTIPYEPLRSTGNSFRDSLVGIFEIAWWLWGAWFLVDVIRAVLVLESRLREGKLVQDLLSALIYVSALESGDCLRA